MLKESGLFFFFLMFCDSKTKVIILSLFLLYSIAYPQIYSKVNLFYKPTPFTQKILSDCPSLKKGFYPTFWLFNGLLQAFFEGTLGNIPTKSVFCDEILYETEFLTLPDGGLMSID